MKTLKKISLKNAKILQPSEMKEIIGHGTGCGGYSGTCGWTSAWGRCTCGAGYVG